MRIKKTILTIDGMTCINCQNRIEKALKNTDGVIEVHVSYQDGQAEITYDSEQLKLERMISVIQDLDYQVVDKRKKKSKSIETIVIIILLFYILQHFEILNLLVPSKLADSKMSYGMLFVVGLLTSVHCIAMCGGINLSQCIPTSDSSDRNNILIPAILYNVGRVISYTVIGFMLGGIGLIITGGSQVGIPLIMQGILKIIAGSLMVVMGINMLGIFPKLRQLQMRFPRLIGFKIITKKKTQNNPFVVGLLNGLMPCGPMQSIQIIALGSGNPISGAMSMLMFSLGTVPLMLGLGGLVSALGKKYTTIVMRIGSILVVVLGLALFSQGLSLAGIKQNYLDISNQTKELNKAIISDEENIQVVESKLTFGSYPSITLYQGIPVKWIIQVPEEVINGCNYKMIINDYGITHEFTSGENVIEFTPEETGTIQYTCWMGMIDGEITVIEKGD